MNSKYIVFALAFLLTFSATSVVTASTGTLLNPVNVATHGPLISSVTFSVISSDSPLEGALSSGGIQAAEWTFTVSSYGSLETNPNVASGTTQGYTWEGLAFNTIRPWMNNVDFRRAMASLEDYSYIQGTVCSGVACVATPYVLPCAGYGFMCGNEPTAYTTSESGAANYLILAGLCGSNDGITCLTTGEGASATSTTVWSTPSNLPCNPSGTPTACLPGVIFAPKLQYRSDDPLRTGVAEGLIANAAEIGFGFTVEGIAGSGGLIYGPSVEAVVHGGTYNPSTGYNSAPEFNSTVVNGTSAIDLWDMYTYGWVTSVYPTAQAEFFDSQFIGSEYEFVNFYNPSMDYYANGVLYGDTVPAAETAGIGLAKIAMQQLPYMNFYFENTLFADYVNGWTGYANEPTTGPNTGVGIYYSLLNVHSTTNSTGGNLDYAIHEQSDAGGMNPEYGNNWVWQVDLWSEVYDTPLATIPTEVTTLNAFLPYMVSSYSVVPYTGKVPAGSFLYQKGEYPSKLTNGQEITLNFVSNITFSDGVPFTAKDYQESLYAFDIAYSPKLPDVVTPFAGLLSGPEGLIASKVTVSKTVDSIEIFINSNSVWNLAESVVNVEAQHILTYFNLDHFATGVTEVDTTLPFLSNGAYFTAGAPKAPKWMTYEPNMEIGTGPFTLTTFSETTGDGVLTANPNYFRSAWYANMGSITPGNSYTNTYTIQMYINNPTGSAYCGVAPGTQGYCGITGKVTGESSVKLKNVVTIDFCSLVNANTGEIYGCSPVLGFNGKPATYNLVQTIYPTTPKKLGYTDLYTVTIPTGTTATVPALAPGNYEVVLQTQFTFQGLARVWYQYTGFTVT